MSVKEQIIKLMQEAGYDFFTAAEWATRILQEFRDGPDNTRKYYIIKGATFTLVKSSPKLKGARP